MFATMVISWAWLLGAVPLLFLAFWHAADAWYGAAFFLKHGKKSLPPGHMGVPFLGETLSLLWYFKHAHRPDEFIGAKKKAYGKAAGMYRTHLFGSPTIIACTPAANKFVLQSPENFGVHWPEPELVGHTSVVNVEGATHTRLRGFILATINSPRSLRTIAAVVQPRVVAALASWSDKGTIVAATEIKKVRTSYHL
jgi:ent-kaurenoic acid hydroxylase